MSDTPKPLPANESGVASASDALRWAIWLLLVIYIFPLVLISGEYLATGFVVVRTPLTLFIGMTATSDDSFAILHRALLPLMGGFAPLAFRDERSSKSAIAIMALLLLGILLSILLYGVFNSFPVQDVLQRSTLFSAGDATNSTQAKSAAFAAGIVQIKGFLNRTQEAMAMYLLLMFGLKLEKATR